MKNLLFVLALVVLLSSFSHATIIYDNGQYNVLNSFVNDDAFVIDSSAYQPTTLEIVSGGNLVGSCYIYGSSKVILNEGNIGHDLTAYDSSTIEMHSGSIGRNIFLYNSSQGKIYSGSVLAPVFTHGSVVLTIEGGTISTDLSINDFSIVYLKDGSIARHVFIRNDGLLEMTGGNAHGSITANNDAKFLMSGGNIGYDLFAEDTSTVEISGGWIDRIMYARHDAEITMIGTNFNYPLGYIADVSGTITGTLANGDPIEVSFVRGGNGAILLKDPCIVLTVVVPNGGERYLTDKPVDIEYITSGDATIDTVDIEYSSDNGSSWITIVTGISNTGIYEWTTPDIESENCIVRVSSADNPTITDTSDSTFIIFQCSEVNPADINNDCYVNLLDLAILAENWLWCGDKYNPICGIE